MGPVLFSFVMNCCFLAASSLPPCTLAPPAWRIQSFCERPFGTFQSTLLHQGPSLCPLHCAMCAAVALMDMGSSSTRMLLLDADTKELLWSNTSNPCLTASDATAAFGIFEAALSQAGTIVAVSCTSFVGNYVQSMATGICCEEITTYAAEKVQIISAACTEKLASLCGALPCAAYLTGNFSAVQADCLALDCLGSWMLRSILSVPRHISMSEAAWLGVLPWAAASPAVGSVSEVVRESSQLHTALGLLPEVQTEPMAGQLFGAQIKHVIPCIGDGAAAALGSAALVLSDAGALSAAPSAPTGPAQRPIVSISIGTSAAVRCVLPLNQCTEALLRQHVARLVAGCGGWVYRIAPDAVLVGAAITDGAAALQDVQHLLTDAFAFAAPAGRAGAVIAARTSMHRCMDELATGALLQPADGAMLPLSGGERAPGMRGGQTSGIMTGIRRQGGLGDALLSRVQGVCCQLAQLLQLLLPVLGVEEARDCYIVGSGGALEKGALWRRVLANVLQAPLFTADQRPLGVGAVATPQSQSAPNKAPLALETTSLGLLVHTLWEARQQEQRAAAAAAPCSAAGTAAAAAGVEAGRCASPSSFAAAAAASASASTGIGGDFRHWLRSEFPSLPRLSITAPDAGADAAAAWAAASDRYCHLYTAAEGTGLLPPRVTRAAAP